MKHSESLIDDIEELFDRADEDDDDQLSPAEFRSLMLELDSRLHESTIAANFREIDTNRDGRLGFAEFRSWWLSNSGSR